MLLDIVVIYKTVQYIGLEPAMLIIRLESAWTCYALLSMARMFAMRSLPKSLLTSGSLNGLPK
jgi:hypothetical protein